MSKLPRFEACFTDAVALMARGDGVRAMLARALLQTGIVNRFQYAVSNIDITNDKPNVEPFLTAAQQLGLTAAACVVFEDVAAGVQAAQQSGCYCIAIDRARQPGRLRGAHQLIGCSVELAPSPLFAIDTETGDV